MYIKNAHGCTFPTYKIATNIKTDVMTTKIPCLIWSLLQQIRAISWQPPSWWGIQKLGIEAYRMKSPVLINTVASCCQLDCLSLGAVCGIWTGHLSFLNFKNALGHMRLGGISTVGKTLHRDKVWYPIHIPTSCPSFTPNVGPPLRHSHQLLISCQAAHHLSDVCSKAGTRTLRLWGEVISNKDRLSPMTSIIYTSLKIGWNRYLNIDVCMCRSMFIYVYVCTLE